MSKLTKTVARVKTALAASRSVVFPVGARRDDIEFLLDQIENDRKTISQLNEKHMAWHQQFRNLKARGAYERLVRDQKIEELTAKIEDQNAALKTQASVIESISQDRAYWQGEARRLEAELAGVRNHFEKCSPRVEVQNSHAVNVSGRLSFVEPTNEHREHVEFHLRAQAENKLARIAEIVGTTDVPEKTIRNYASTGLTAAQLLSELLAAKVEAVAGILDED